MNDNKLPDIDYPDVPRYWFQDTPEEKADKLGQRAAEDAAEEEWFASLPEPLTKAQLEANLRQAIKTLGTWTRVEWAPGRTDHYETLNGICFSLVHKENKRTGKCDLLVPRQARVWSGIPEINTLPHLVTFNAQEWTWFMQKVLHARKVEMASPVG